MEEGDDWKAEEEETEKDERNQCRRTMRAFDDRRQGAMNERAYEEREEEVNLRRTG